MLLLVQILIVSGVSSDCPNMISLAIGLHMDVKQPAIMASLNTDCCTATGVTCIGALNQKVSQIYWTGLDLDGTILGPKLPSTLTVLDLGYNAITGTIPSALPNNLQYLALWYNYNIYGSIPGSLPITLSDLRIAQNQINGTIP